MPPKMTIFDSESLYFETAHPDFFPFGACFYSIRGCKLYQFASPILTVRAVDFREVKLEKVNITACGFFRRGIKIPFRLVGPELYRIFAKYGDNSEYKRKYLSYLR